MSKTKKPAQEISNRVKVHTQYFSNNGDSVVGVTTVLNTVLAKPALIHWSWECGMKGLDYRKMRDKAGDVGTITHLLIMHHLKKTEPDLSEFSPKDVEASQNCMKSFYEWEKQHKLEPLILEIPLVSDIYGFGGTPDFIGKVDGNLEILDYKSGGGHLFDLHHPAFSLQTTCHRARLPSKQSPHIKIW